LSFVLADIVHDVEMKAWLEVLKICHMCKPFLHLFEAGEMLMD